MCQDIGKHNATPPLVVMQTTKTDIDKCKAWSICQNSRDEQFTIQVGISSKNKTLIGRLDDLAKNILKPTTEIAVDRYTAYKRSVCEVMMGLSRQS